MADEMMSTDESESYSSDESSPCEVNAESDEDEVAEDTWWSISASDSPAEELGVPRFSSYTPKPSFCTDKTVLYEQLQGVCANTHHLNVGPWVAKLLYIDTVRISLRATCYVCS